tara:strand:- start:269 stop:439 length:171 start_codon:yes stop_codon:yes gene_type:complete
MSHITLLGPNRKGFGKLSIFFDHLDTVDELIFNILETSFLEINLFLNMIKTSKFLG